MCRLFCTLVALLTLGPCGCGSRTPVASELPPGVYVNPKRNTNVGATNKGKPSIINDDMNITLRFIKI